MRYRGGLLGMGLVVACFAFACGAFACSTTVEKIDDEGDGGSGGLGAGGPSGTTSGKAQSASGGDATVSSGNASGSMSQVSSSSTGPDVPPGSVCDDESYGSPESLWCKQCQSCALPLICQQQVDACESSSDCVAYYECLQTCRDCSCQAEHPEGSALHEAIIDCLLCACASNCGQPQGCAS